MKFRLIVITAEELFAGETESISKLFPVGLQTLHIRKPGCSKSNLKKFIASIPSKYHRRLVIHSHYSLLSDFKLKGIHLTEKTKRKTIPRHFNKNEHSLSASFHSARTIAAAKRNYDYVFLSPVFDSISKKGHKSRIDLTILRSLITKHKNIIALGGVTDRNIELVQRSGFSGAAVLGCIWQAKDPIKKFRKLLSKI